MQELETILTFSELEYPSHNFTVSCVVFVSSSFKTRRSKNSLLMIGDSLFEASS